MTDQSPTATGPGQKPSGSRLGLVIVGGIVAFFVLALGAAVLFSGGSDDGEVAGSQSGSDSGSDNGSDSGSESGAASAAAGDGQELSSVTMGGRPLVALPAGVQVSDSSNDPAVGAVAPTVVGTNFAGETVEIGPGDNAKMVMFLAHWCPHCQREMPVVVDLIAAGKLPPGIEVYAVSTAVDLSRGNPPSSWFADEGWTAPVVRDDAENSTFSSYGGAGFPYVVYLDSENRVLTRTAGEFGPDAIEDLWLAIVGG